MEDADQQLREHHEVRLAPGALRLETPDEARDDQHAAAGDESVTPSLAPVLPLLEDDHGPERAQDRHPGPSRELDEDGREGRERRPRRTRESPCFVTGKPHLVERALAEASEPAVQGARVQRREAGRHAPEPVGGAQVARDRPLDDGQRVDLPRRQVAGEHARPVLAATAAGHRKSALRDRTLDRQVLQEDGKAKDSPRREDEQSHPAAAGALDVAQEARDQLAAPLRVGEERIVRKRHADGY